LRKKQLLTSICLFLFTLIAYSQTATIRGIVVDENNLPVPEVNITYGNGQGTTTNFNGFYQIEIPANQEVTLTFSSIQLKKIVQTFNLKSNADYEFNPVMLLDIEQLGPVVIDGSLQRRAEGIINLDPVTIRNIPGPSAGVENLLKSFASVSNSNELSTNYNVRGGNFDDNLVYVNEIEVYRPFLIRSGQQEGFSFVNSDLTQKVSFSAGGFQAKYGDKLASVLDITYRRPTQFGASLNASFLGVTASVEGQSKDGRLTAIAGLRFRDNSLLVSSRQTESNITPVFADAQTYITYKFSNKFQLDFLGNIGINDYDFEPLNRQTNFGTLQDPISLLILFDGQEEDKYETYFGSFKGTYSVNENLTLKLITSAYLSQEQEFFDILAQYRLGTPNNNIGDEDFGDVEFTEAAGAQFLSARNFLDALYANVEFKGTYLKNESQIDWGVKYTREDVRDQLQEFEILDSAGFSIRPPLPDFANDQPFNPFDAPIEPFTNIRSRNDVQINRVSGFAQYNRRTDWGDNEVWLNVGVRAHQWSVSGDNIESTSQAVVSPRGQFSIKPNWKQDMVFRLSGGYYHQPPGYRELRDSIGAVIPDVKAQQSIQVVAGHDWSFRMWGNSPFKLVSEAYYKDLTDVNTYTLENVRIRYRANNNATARVYGFDTRLSGEFVKGTESWISLGFLKAEENPDNRGFIARPTDQRFKAAFLFQDYVPNVPSLRLYLNMVYQTGLPGGTPSNADPFDFEELPRLPDFFRTDIGVSYVFVDAEKQFEKGHWLHGFKDLSLGVEIYNIFDRLNSITNTFVRDANSGQQFAVPNFLTPRVFNVRLSMRL